MRVRKTRPAFVLGAAVLLSLSGAAAQEPTPEAVAKAKTAVDPVTKLFKINPGVKMPGSDKALDNDGAWSARPATAAERPAVCEAQGASCSEVIHRPGQPEIVCMWTVLVPEKGEANDRGRVSSGLCWGR